MLNITVKPGEYFMIGDDIRVVFTGGTANNARIMIDAPKSYNIVRGKVLERNEEEGIRKTAKNYFVEPKLSEEQLARYRAQQAKKR